MSKDLYYTIPEYFLERMRDHSNVRRVEDISTNEFYLYRIYRIRQEDSVIVWLSDAYRFTDMDFENRPRELRAGDYALVAKPEGSLRVSPELIAEARIGVGKLAELMGALTKPRMWTYERPSRDDRQRRGSRSSVTRRY